MFTGLIQEVGQVERTGRKGGFLTAEIAYDELLGQLRKGDSMAVNGVCLTATAVGGGSFTAELSGQTQKLTTLGGLRPGWRVNLERPVTASDPLGGHIVLGHADGVGRIRRSSMTSAGLNLTISAPRDVMALTVDRGSIAVDGISLTVGDVSADSFVLFIIPETVERTTIGAKRAGDQVNLEADYLAKLVKKFLQRDQGLKGLFPVAASED